MPEGVLRGAKAIGRALGVSERTVRRWAKAGRLAAEKAGQHTSPLQIKRADLVRRRQILEGEEA